VGTTIAGLGHWITGLREERRRRRELYARALAATLDYREFPYVIPRRRSDAPAEERVRISEALRRVQSELSYCQSWMRLERSTKVAAAYRALVSKTREIAGGEMHEAWKRPPITSDKEINTTRVDYSSIQPFEDAFLAAVQEDLAWWKELAFWRH
jgi:hypothetical protein